MLRRVKIKKLPQAKTGFQVEGSLYNDVPAMGGGADYNAYIGKPNLKLSKYITAVPREEANLEAEGGETVFGDINGDGMPEHKVIKGPRHSEGGVPLNLPDDSFIFSDTKGMKIKDPNFLVTFGKKSGSYTPASLAKQYDIDRYRKILQDPDSDVLDRKTAELMIKNYNIKLGALALAQESKKGFPQGIPAVAMPYMQAMGLKEEDVLPDKQITATIDQLDKQTNNERSAATMASPTEEEDNMFGSEAEEAQMINSDRPVAQPEPEVDEEAGMTPEETQMQFGGMMMQDSAWSPDEIAVFTGTIPYAAYGMAMGANSQNYEGRDRRIPAATRFFKDGGLPKAQDDLQIDGSNMSNDELQRAIWNAKEKHKADWLKSNPGKTEKDYTGAPKISVTTKDESGKTTTKVLKKEGFRVPTGAKLTASDLQGFPDTEDGRVAAAQYALIKKNLENPKVKEELIKNTKQIVDDPKAWKGKTASTVDPNKKWSKIYGDLPADNEIVTAALNHQKRNLMFRANGVDPQLFNDIGNKLDDVDKVLSEKYINPKTGKPYTKEEATEALKNLKDKGYTSIATMSDKLNVPLDPKGKDRLLQQSTMHAYAKAYKDFSDGAYKDDPDAQFAMNNFLGNVSMIHSGAADEKSMGALYGAVGNKISPLDDTYDYNNTNWYGSGKGKYTTYGDTTAGHQYMVGEYFTEFEDPESPENKEPGKEPTPGKTEEPCPCEKSDGTRIEVGRNPNTGECNPCEEEVKVDVQQPAEWWLQDTIKTTGAFGDLMSIKKHMPWAPRVDLETPRPTFLDPTRELAANAEQANIQTQGMAQFAGPQAMSARSSSVQGQAAKNAADVLSRYNNANVNLANQFEMQSTNIRNQEQMMNQAATQRLYDQNTIANQQFDNAKLAMRNNLRNQYVNAITNRAQTDTLNKLYPQYAVQPGTGGFLVNKPGKELTGESTTGPDYWAQRKKCVDEGAADPDACAKNAMQTGSTGGTTSNKGAVANQMGYGKKFGGQMKEGGFAYADIAYPFIL